MILVEACSKTNKNSNDRGNIRKPANSLAEMVVSGECQWYLQRNSETVGSEERKKHTTLKKRKMIAHANASQMEKKKTTGSRIIRIKARVVEEFKRSLMDSTSSSPGARYRLSPVSILSFFARLFRMREPRVSLRNTNSKTRSVPFEISWIFGRKCSQYL